jgi:hypothetical protein
VICGVLLGAAVFAGCSGKQESGELLTSPPAIVTIGDIPDVAMRPGQETLAVVSITVAEGYHVQANPASDEFLVPLTLELDPIEGFVFGTPEYPAGVAYRLEGTDSDLMTYEGTFAVKIPITTAMSGTFGMKGSVNFQACDSKRCLMPSSVPVEFKVVVGVS